MPMTLVDILPFKCCQTRNKNTVRLIDTETFENNHVVWLGQIFIFYPSMDVIYVAFPKHVVLYNAFNFSSYEISLDGWRVFIVRVEK